MRRVRSRVAVITGSGAPADNPNPPGSSLTVDFVGNLDVIYAETSLTPADNAAFDLAVTMAETSSTPVDAIALLDITSSGDAPATPAGGHTFLVTYTVAGAGTWVCPAGVTTVTVDAWAGGGGAANATTTTSGGGGGGGAYSRSTLNVDPGTTYNLNVGAPGNNGVSGTTGGDSWFNTTAILLAKGGQNGGGGGAGGAAASGVGTTKFSGGAGFTPGVAAAGGGGGGGAGNAANGGASSSATGGAGGNAQGGAGGTGGAAVTGGVGTNGSLKGGGGGGGGFSATAPGAGGDGARGEIQLTYTVPDRTTHPVFDGFERADSTTSLGTADSGQAWTVLAGTWGISSGQAYPAAVPGDLHAGAVIDSGLSDAIVMVKQVNSTQESGIIFRATDNNNYWIFTAGSGIGAGALYKRVAGTFTFVVGASGSAANGDVYTVSMVGSVLTAFRNGTQIATATDSFNSTATKHGLRGYANTSPRLAAFDVYSV